MIYRIDETTSTNDEARDAKYRHGDIVWAERQTAGRGQRGHTWTSPEGENLTFSMVLEPRFLPVGEQFLLSEAVTLALTDTFAAYGIDTHIKWTNDIYVGDRKLVGILIEHNHAGASLSRTIAGIGINVNQTAFDPALPNPSPSRRPGAASSTAAGCSKPFWSAACGVTPSSNGAKRRPSSTPTANGCTGWANSTPTGCPTARCFRPRSKACFPPAN